MGLEHREEDMAGPVRAGGDHKSSPVQGDLWWDAVMHAGEMQAHTLSHTGTHTG